MNRTFVRRLAVAVTVLLAPFVAIAAPASASTDVSGHGGASPIPLAAQVTRVEHAGYAPVRESVDAFLANAARSGHRVPAQVAEDLTVHAATITCWYWNDWRKAKNVFGATVWQFNVEPHWCGDGSWIRNYAYTNTWGTTSWVGWQYNGVIQSSDHYGVNWNMFESVRQGSFCYINFYGCVQNSYPYVDVQVGPGGQIYKS